MATTKNNQVVDSYVALLNTLIPELRLDIISKLAESLKSEVLPKANLMEKSFGSWVEDSPLN